MIRCALVTASLLLAGCGNEPSGPTSESVMGFEERLAETYRSKPDHSSRAYALVKDGLGGEAWLATIHGYPDNRSVCEELIAPYNEDESLSTLPGQYACKELA